MLFPIEAACRREGGLPLTSGPLWVHDSSVIVHMILLTVLHAQSVYANADLFFVLKLPNLGQYYSCSDA